MGVCVGGKYDPAKLTCGSRRSFRREREVNGLLVFDFYNLSSII